MKYLRKIAIFRHVKMDFETSITSRDGSDDYALEGYTRLTKWVEVEFEELPPEAVVEAQLKELAELRAQTVSEFTQKLAEIDGRTANLRALAGPVSP